jgi:phosphatidylglycerol:prolipoprotein diacylglycerol transferase
MLSQILSIPSGFSLFGHTIKFYGIISAISYLLGVVITCLLAKKRGFKSDDILTLALYVIPLAIIGARVYYVLFRLDHYTNFVDVFKIWEGGLAFYGGLIGGGLGVLLYCLIHKKNFFALADLIMVAMVFSQGVGRWGNFFNQEAYGNLVTDPNLQWFPFAVYIENVGQWHLATFFYESLWNFLTFGILLTLLLKVKFKQNGMVCAFYLVLYGIGRTWIEGLRTDSLYLGSLRVSQVLSIIFIVIGLFYILFNTIRNRSHRDTTDKIIKIIKSDF